MRGIRGYILNLADGQGPPTGTVDVSAKPRPKPANLNDPVELDLSIHRLGALTVRHQPGSQSRLKADQAGHFGWDMELSPGTMDIAVTPHDPQTEYRRRFPDESAQIGKAFITDLERLGWAGGRDGLIWDAVFDGHRPTASTWSTNPAQSRDQGNWGTGAQGTGANAGRMTIKQGIAMLGGVVFSVEMGDILVPVVGEDPSPPNATSQDRWDLFCLRMDWNKDSPEFGKQSFEVTKGVAGAGIPPFPGNTGNFRRLPLHAVKMPANSNTYNDAYDLRQWLTPPSINPAAARIQQRVWVTDTTQGITLPGNTTSNLNATMASDPVTLALDRTWEGILTWEASVIAQKSGDTGTIRNLYVLPTTRVFNRDGSEVTPGDFVNFGAGYPNVGHVAMIDSATFYASATFPIRPIPSYQDSTPSRTWDRLLVGVTYAMSYPSWDLRSQRVVLTMRAIN